MHATKMSVYISLSGKILTKTRRINNLLNTWSYFLPQSRLSSKEMVTLLLVRNTVEGYQATNTMTDTGVPRSRESGDLVYLS